MYNNFQQSTCLLVEISTQSSILDTVKYQHSHLCTLLWSLSFVHCKRGFPQQLKGIQSSPPHLVCAIV